MKTSSKKTFLQLLFLGLVVALVILIFKMIQPLRLAALTASVLFLAVSCGIIYSENKWGRARRSLSFWMAILFLVLFVIPIIGLRLIYWNSDFQDIWIGSIRAQALHEMSSRCYLLLIGTVVYEGVRPHLPGRKNRAPKRT